MGEMTEPYITPEDLTNLRARDDRWEIVNLSLRIDAELRESLLLNLVIEAATRRAEQAKDRLAEISPSDINGIIALQAEAQCAKLIGETLSIVKNSAENAFASIREEERIHIEPKEG